MLYIIEYLHNLFRNEVVLLFLHFSRFGRLRILPFVSSVVAASEVDDGVVVSMAYDTVTTRQKTLPNDTQND